MRKTFMIGILAIGVVIGFAGASALQEGTMPKGDEDDMKAPTPLDDPMSDKMVGTWKWEGKMWHEGAEMPLNASEEIHWGIGHQFVLHSYKSYMPDGTVAYEALGVGRPDPKTGKTTLWWFDNHGSLSVFNGQRTENGETAMAEGDHGNMKSSVTMNEDGTVRHEMQFQPPGSDEWMPMLDCVGTKGAMDGGMDGDGKVGRKPGGKGAGRGKGGMGGGK